MGLVIGVEPPDGRDAMWRPRPGLTPPVVRPTARRGAQEDERPATDMIMLGSGGDPTSPWSPHAVDTPLPSIAEIRDRWRAELAAAPDVEADDDNESPPAAEPVSSSPDPSVRRRAISVPGQPPSSTTGEVVLVGLVVGVVVATALAFASVVRPVSAAPPVDVLPATATQRWSATIGAAVDQTSFDADESAAVTIADGTLVVRDAADGTVRWRRDVETTGRQLVGLYGDVVVQEWRPDATGAGTVVRGYAADDGSVRWSRELAGELHLLPDALVEYAWTDDVPVVHVIDPVTGNELGPAVRAVKLVQPADFVIGQAGGLVALDARTGRVASTVVPDLEVEGMAPVGDHTVVFTASDDVVLYGRGGSVLDARRFRSDAIGDFRGRAGLVGGVPGTSLVVVASGSSVGLDVGSGRIVQRWEVPGRVGEPVETARGPAAPARLVDPVTGQVDTAIVDLVSGATIAVTDDGTTRTGDPIIVRDGYVAAPEVGDPTPELLGVDFDGVRRWSLPADDAVWYAVRGGTLYVVHRDGQLTAHR